MASVAVNSDAAVVGGGGGALHMDSIPVVDLRFFSQSELYSLSLCSSSAFDPRRCDDVVIPKIDRSVFNESAGSRKQTYSRLRLLPPSESRRRDSQICLVSTSFPVMNDGDSVIEDAENVRIVNLLKQLFVADVNLSEFVSLTGDNSEEAKCRGQFLPPPPFSFQAKMNITGNTRKRVGPWSDKIRNKQEESGGVDSDKGTCLLPSMFPIANMDNDRGILNKDGAAVDLVALGSVEHPYREEVERRTQGLRSKEEFVGFLEGLQGGQCTSRRKRKMIVDASLFGSALPVGWKIMLSIKNKNGQIQLCCRRYISPGGLYFVTCRGVSSYLCSLHGIQCAHASYYVHYNEMVSDADKLASATTADHPVEIGSQDVNLASKLLPSADHEIEIDVNSLDVELNRVGEIIYCSNCDATFSCEEDLVKHSAVAHKRKRLKNVHESNEVISKDGKYECLFCDNILDDRDQYTAHVDTHVSSEAAGDSLAVGVGNFNNLNSSSQFYVEDLVDGEPLKSNGISAVDHEISNIKLPICPPCYKQDEHPGALTDANMSRIHVPEVNEANPSSVAAVLHSMRMNLLEYGRNTVSGGKMIEHDKISLNRSPDISDDETQGSALLHKNGISGPVEKSEQQIAPQNRFLYSKNDEGECGSVDQEKHENMRHMDGSAGVMCQLEQEVMPSQQNMHYSEYGNAEVCRTEMKAAESDDVEYPVNDHFESRNGVLDSTPASKTDHGRKYEMCSAFTSDKIFAEENMNTVFNDDMECHREEQSECALFGVSASSGISDGGGVFHSMYANPSTIHGRHHEIENSRMPDPSLSFGDLQTKICSDSNGIEQRSYRQGYINQASSRMMDCSTPGDLKLGMSYAFDFTGAPFNNRRHESGRNFEISQPERDWNGSRGEQLRTYSQNLIVGIENNGSQFGERMNADVSWRTRLENDLHGCFPATSVHRTPPSNHFHTFGITGNQGARTAATAFGAMKNASHGEMMTRLGNSEPVEYCFMGDGTSNLLPREQHNMLSYRAKTDEEPGPAFWLGKDALTPNTPTTTTMGLAASVCVLCRNLFFHEPVLQPGLIHGGAIANMCPSCRSRFPGQFNLL